MEMHWSDELMMQQSGVVQICTSYSVAMIVGYKGNSVLQNAVGPAAIILTK